MGLVQFAQRALRSKSVAEIGGAILDEAGALAGSRGVGLNVASGHGWLTYTRGVPQQLLERYEAVGRKNDILLADVKRAHAPGAVSIAALRAAAHSRRLPEAYISLLDYSIGYHYMLAPVVVEGVIIGTLNFARAEDHAYDARDLGVASALALHVSTRMTALRALDRIDRRWRDVLTSRSFEVAELAARGLTTHEVGRMLGVSSNTVKKHLRTIYERLAVSSRAELATLLATPPVAVVRTGAPRSH